MRKKIYKIVGAGLSGLTAAINLAKKGYQVEVYEKCSQVGKHYPENPQMLPNWFSEEDVIEELEKCNIKINWVNKIRQIEVLFKNQKVIFSSQKTPTGYTVLRGGERSLEKDLARQAKKLGVNIITNCPDIIDADILATGESQILTLGYGRVYRGEFEPEKVKVFFSPKYTPTLGYYYLYPHGKDIATVKISKKVSEGNVNLKENLQNFLKEKLVAGEIKEQNFLYHFSTKRSFKIPKSAKINNSLLVGESAGFQDELFRFGMRYAIISGYLAAKSITEGLDYDKLWKKKFSEEFQRTARTRRVFSDFKKGGFSNLPEGLELYVDIERFKKFWLSAKTSILLSLYPSYRKLFNNKLFVKILLKLLPKFLL